MRLPCFEIGSISAHGSLFVTRHAQYGFLAWRRTRSGWRQRAAGRGAAYALLSRIILTVAIFLISAAGFPSPLCGICVQKGNALHRHPGWSAVYLISNPGNHTRVITVKAPKEMLRAGACICTAPVPLPASRTSERVLDCLGRKRYAF